MKLLFTSLALCMFLIGSAQNFVYSTDQDLRLEETNSNYLGGEVKFTTPEPEDITFKWRKLKTDVPAEWSFSLCGYGTCHVGLPSSGTFLPITKTQMEDGKEAYFILNTSPKTFDSAYLQLYVYDQNDQDRGDTVSITLVNKGVSSISIAPNKAISIYPNPAKDLINIRIPNDGQTYTASMSNLLGETILEIGQLNSGVNGVDVSTLSKGIYFVQLSSTDGSTKTQKVIVE